MKVYVCAARRSPKTANVYKVCEAMGWSKPTFIDLSPNGYRVKWGGYSFHLRNCMQPTIRKLEEKYGDSGIDVIPNTYANLEHETTMWLMELLNLSYSDAVKLLDKTIQECTQSGAIDEYINNILDEIEEKTGIKCHLNRGGHLIIPFAENT